MKLYKKIFQTGLLYSLFLIGCGGSNDDGVQSGQLLQSDGAESNSITFKLPERIRTSRAVNLDATNVTVTTNAGNFDLQRVGDEFRGSIDVEPGTLFTYQISIWENIAGDRVIYAEGSNSIDGAITEDTTVTFNPGSYTYPDDDGDGANNLSEVEAGSNYANSFSTPSNPNGTAPVDTNPGLVQFTTDTYSVAEADGSLTISVARSDGSDGRVTVNYEVLSETATLGSDFQSSRGQLVWEDGDSATKSFTVVVNSDDEIEGNQTFTARLMQPNGGIAIGSGFARITLTDSTPPAQRGTIALSSAQYTVDESANQVRIEVARVNGSDGAVSVEFNTSPGTATEDDFTAVSNTLSWDDGEAGTRTVRISINDDTEVEDAETFTVNLSGIIGGATLGQDAASVVINDTTTLPTPGQIALNASTYALSEGGSTNILVNRLNGSDGDATVEYAITSGTADDDDYTASSGTLTWSAGENGPRTITIAAVADDELEADETIIVTLSNVSGATLGTGTATITIIDSTVAVPGVIAFASVSSTVTEGNSVDVAVTRNEGSDGRVSVAVSAPASGEYTVSPATLVWADGDSEDKTITIIAVADDVTGDTETVTVSLSNATGDATLGPAAIVVTISDTTEEPVTEEPVTPDPTFTALPTDGEWEVCVAPYNTDGPTAFATQLSVNEGRVVSCIKTCDATVIDPDPDFPGWGWNPADLHSCVVGVDAPGTYTAVPVYTPGRQAINLDLTADDLTGANTIWGCVNETRANAEFNFEAETPATVWYQFLDDGTYFSGSSDNGAQPTELIGPEVWSVNGRTLELGLINVGYRNTLFFPGGQTLHIFPTTDDRISCTRERQL